MTSPPIEIAVTRRALAEVVHRLGFEPPQALLAAPVPNARGETIDEVRLGTSVS